MHITHRLKHKLNIEFVEKLSPPSHKVSRKKSTSIPKMLLLIDPQNNSIFV